MGLGQIVEYVWVLAVWGFLTAMVTASALARSNLVRRAERVHGLRQEMRRRKRQEEDDAVEGFMPFLSGWQTFFGMSLEILSWIVFVPLAAYFFIRFTTYEQKVFIPDFNDSCSGANVDFGGGAVFGDDPDVDRPPAVYSCPHTLRRGELLNTTTVRETNFKAQSSVELFFIGILVGGALKAVAAMIGFQAASVNQERMASLIKAGDADNLGGMFTLGAPAIWLSVVGDFVSGITMTIILLIATLRARNRLPRVSGSRNTFCTLALVFVIIALSIFSLQFIAGLWAWGRGGAKGYLTKGVAGSSGRGSRFAASAAASGMFDDSAEAGRGRYRGGGLGGTVPEA